MREIKVRGKRTVDGEWIYGDLITETDGDLVVKRTFIHLRLSTIDFSENSMISKLCLHEIDPETVGQYTGLKDKNGKEIYEGDICQGASTIYEITWVEKSAKFGAKVIRCGHVLPRGCTFPLQDYVKEGTLECVFEVIGNVHESPNPLQQPTG